MLQVTELANAKLVEYLQENNIDSALRVFLSPGGCSGPSLGLALDEEQPQDEVYRFEPLKFVVERNLLHQCGTITVDYVDGGSQAGFSLHSEIPLPSGGGCQSGSCSSCG